MVNLATDARRLAATAKQLGAVLVILDPLRNLIPGGEERDNDLAGLVLDDLRRHVCRDAGAAVIIATHYRKPGRGEDRDTGPTVDDVRGAGAWTAGARLVFALAKPLNGDTMTLTCLKANRVRAASLGHTLHLTIEADPAHPAAWTSCTLSDASASGTSDAYTPGRARDLTDHERAALEALSDAQEPGLRLSWSAWYRRSGIASENTFRNVKERLVTARLAEALPTGKSRSGQPGYTYAIADAGRAALQRTP